ncbi:hypothetical protein V7056_11420 [Bacillus sp. JJ664]
MGFSILIIVISVILSGCKISKSKVEQPVKEYLKSELNINDGYKILAAENDGECGCNNYAYVEFNKPYRTYARLAFDQDTNLINLEWGDNAYFKLFKGAYVKQHPELIELVDKIMTKKHLMKDTSNVSQEIKEISFYDYIDIAFSESQEKKLIETFKQNKTIETNKIVPTLKLDGRSRGALVYRGVINFNFLYDEYKQKHRKVPQAIEILKEFEKNKVLSEGLYSINIEITSTNPEWELIDDKHASYLAFKVDRSGKFKDLRLIKEDENTEFKEIEIKH